MVFSPLNHDLSGLSYLVTLICYLIKAEDMNLHYIVPVLNAKTFDNFNFQLAEFSVVQIDHPRCSTLQH